MPKSILDWKTRRAILESRKAPSPDELTRAGRELMAAGRPAEAWEFFKRSGDRAALEELRQAAVADGDYFLYSLAAGVLGLGPDSGALSSLASAARSMGKEVSALKAEAAMEVPNHVPVARDDAGGQRRRGRRDEPGEEAVQD
ncbi:MAG: hypothetical protein LBT40_01875 [Deltaproteobacteria bacterium]|jgi:hypothetical protein|nr:hypothetical protein [Deltaproteobacteria bacterium]